MAAARNGTQVLPTLVSGTRFQYRVENAGSVPLYLQLIGLDASGDAIALYCPRSETEVDSGGQLVLQEPRLNPGETVIIPPTATEMGWVATGPTGLVQIALICSTAPFYKTRAALAAANSLKDREQLRELSNSLEVARAILEDLNGASGVAAEIVGSSRESVYAFDVNHWAALNFLFQVV
ncbi:MAG: DUF4384 domain-containing protein [Chloroflexaceae bacterium]|nr:DUF4384 domain-containing protein [Chloroflexaceae bacterium]